MPTIVEIKLSLDVVLPLLELIRAQAADLGSQPTRLMQGLPLQPPALTDLERLLACFPPSFTQTGLLRLEEHLAAPVVRACSLLRLHLRETALAAVPDDILAGALEIERDHRVEKRALMAYVFVGTVQELTLQHFSAVLGAPRAKLPPPTLSWLHRLRALLRPPRSLSSSAPTAPAAEPRPMPLAEGDWQVLVLDDPVNTMTYVTMVFQSVLRVSEAVARGGMQDVHVNKRAVVWRGTREGAERLRNALHAWHLRAVSEPAPAASLASPNARP